MSGLRETLATLAANRWTSADAGVASSRLQEVSAFGPNPGGLRMLVHAPGTLGAKRALVVVLHGCTQTAEGYADGAGWLSLADRLGFVVLCPEQTRANNANLCFNWFQTGDIARGAGEAASIRAMVRRAIDDHDLDPSQVYITGLSAGGAMANVMLATYPEVFAAGAIIAGLPYGAAANVSEAFLAMKGGSGRPANGWGDVVRSASTHAGAWPKVSIWQGDADATVAPGVAQDLVSQWVELHGVSRREEFLTGNSGHRRTQWRTADGSVVVQLDSIAGMGHGAPLACAAPQGCGTPGPFLLEVGVSSTLEIARGWGLAPPGEAIEGETVERLQTTTAPRFEAALDPRASAWGLEGYAGEIISSTLRKAGLLR